MLNVSNLDAAGARAPAPGVAPGFWPDFALIDHLRLAGAVPAALPGAGSVILLFILRSKFG